MTGGRERAVVSHTSATKSEYLGDQYLGWVLGDDPFATSSIRKVLGLNFLRVVGSLRG
jgi:hypothetical protein